MKFLENNEYENKFVCLGMSFILNGFKFSRVIFSSRNCSNFHAVCKTTPCILCSNVPIFSNYSHAENNYHAQLSSYWNICLKYNELWGGLNNLKPE